MGGERLPENVKIGIAIAAMAIIAVLTIVAIIGFSPKYGQPLRLLG